MENSSNSNDETFEVTRYKPTAGEDVGLTFTFDGQHLVVASVAPDSLFAPDVQAGMYLLSMNGMETSDEFMARRIDTLVKRLQGEVTLVTAMPPAIRVTRGKTAKGSAVGVHLRDEASPEDRITIAAVDPDSIFSNSELTVGMQLLSINDMQLDNTSEPSLRNAKISAAQAETWMQRCIRDVTLVAKLCRASPATTTSVSSSLPVPVVSPAPAAIEVEVAPPTPDFSAPPEHFSFLSASQILKLDVLTSRQVLGQTPKRKNIQQDAALAYIFVSHRWEQPGSPDASGWQLASLQSVIRLMQQLLDKSKSLEAQGWSQDIGKLVQGQPQATALVARIQEKVKQQPELEIMLDDNPLHHIFFWYDCCCLPQKQPVPRSAVERVEFSHALQHLDWLVKHCELLCLRIPNDEYDSRAWCAFEHFNKSVVDFGGQVVVDCVNLLEGKTFDWGLTDEKDDAEEAPKLTPITLPPGSEQLPDTMKKFLLQKLKQQQLSQIATAKRTKEVFRETQQTQYKVAQSSWQRVYDSSRERKVPDMVKNANRVQGAVMHADLSTPLQRAMEQMVRDLFQVFYVMSCRDAAKLHGILTVDGDSNACIEGVGIQCGLHGGVTPQQTNRLHQLLHECPSSLFFQARPMKQSEGLMCGAGGHRLVPNICCSRRACDNPTCKLPKRSLPAGSVYVGCLACNLDFCYACALDRVGASSNDEATDRIIGSIKCPKGHSLVCNASGAKRQCSNYSCKAPGGRSIASGTPSLNCSTCQNSKCLNCATAKLQPSERETVMNGIGRSIPTSQKALDTILEMYGFEYPVVEEVQTEPPLCERKVTLDLYKLAADVLHRLDLQCTNDGDVAFVGLLALRNFLREGTDLSDKSKLRLSAGVLFVHVRGVLDEAVEMFSAALAEGRQVSSLVATLVIRAPRWVLLDLSNAASSASANINLEGVNNLCGVKAQDYISKNPHCVSCSLGAVNAPPPVPIKFCEHDAKCHCVWSQCMHRARQLALDNALMITGHSTLDSWSVAKFPQPLSIFGAAVVGKQIYVVGGAMGQFVPETKTYSSRSSKTFVGGFRGSKQWKDTGADLLTPRYHHGCCVVNDKHGEASMIVISGGIDGGNNTLSSMELLSLDTVERGWKQGPSLPTPRKAHLMFCLQNCLFVLFGKNETDDYMFDFQMYNFDTRSWNNGPSLQGPFRPVDAAVVLNRYIFVVGGVSPDNKMSKDSWVLDTSPWIEWCRNGDFSQKPRVSWVRGPTFPQPVSLANLCVVPSTSMENGDEWILSVGNHATGNAVNGIRLPTSSGDVPDWPNLKWNRIGGVPDVIAWCKCCVVDGTLALIAGERFNDTKMLDLVHYRRLDLFADEGMPPLRGVASIDQQGMNFYFHPECNFMTLNDTYLLGRLGFPITEESLFTEDGSRKKLMVYRSPEPKEQAVFSISDLHCQRCLMLTQSVEAARANKNACHFGIRSDFPGLSVPLCSACLCELYCDSS